MATSGATELQLQLRVLPAQCADPGSRALDNLELTCPGGPHIRALGVSTPMVWSLKLISQAEGPPWSPRRAEGSIQDPYLSLEVGGAGQRASAGLIGALSLPRPDPMRSHTFWTQHHPMENVSVPVL